MNRRDSLKNISSLLGIVITGTSAASIMVACKQKSNLPWQPLAFEADTAAFVAELAETILPKTATPGAKDLAVPQFIDAIVKATFTEKDAKAFNEEITIFSEEIEQKFKKNFLDMTLNERLEALKPYDQNMPKSGMSMWGITLEPNAPAATTYKKLKGMTLWGFYTSEEIGTKVFRYVEVPGAFIPCVPYKGENSWTE
jgi:hypothetical protein